MTAFISLFREILGDFDYKTRQEENWILAPIFFIAFVCLIVLVLMFIAIAILEKGYASVQDEIADIQARGQEDKLFAKVSRATMRWTNSIFDVFGRDKAVIAKDRDAMIDQLEKAHDKSEEFLTKFIKYARRKSRHGHELEAALREMARSDADKREKLEEEAAKRATETKAKAREAIEKAFQRRQAEAEMRKSLAKNKESKKKIEELEKRVLEVGTMPKKVIDSGALQRPAEPSANDLRAKAKRERLRRRDSALFGGSIYGIGNSNPYAKQTRGSYS